MKENQQVIKSVQRAIRVLKSFTSDNPEMELSKIAKKDNLPKSTTHRILNTLKREGFISQNKTNGKYKLGSGLFELGNLAFKSVELREVTLPYLEKLSRECGEAVHLGVLRDEEIVSVEVSPSEVGLFNLKVGIYVGDRAPLYCTGVGKATLAFQPEGKIRQILKKKRKKFTKNTIVEKERLEQELQKIREKGYAVDNMEHEKGVRCVAAPIRNHTGRVFGALSISGPSVRVTKENIPELAGKGKKVAKQISKELGFNQDLSSEIDKMAIANLVGKSKTTHRRNSNVNAAKGTEGQDKGSNTFSNDPF